MNDLTLDGLARLRPEEEAHLRLVSGMGEAAVAAFGRPLMRVRRRQRGPLSCYAVLICRAHRMSAHLSQSITAQ